MFARFEWERGRREREEGEREEGGRERGCVCTCKSRTWTWRGRCWRCSRVCDPRLQLQIWGEKLWFSQLNPFRVPTTPSRYRPLCLGRTILSAILYNATSSNQSPLLNLALKCFFLTLTRSDLISDLKNYNRCFCSQKSHSNIFSHFRWVTRPTVRTSERKKSSTMRAWLVCAQLSHPLSAPFSLSLSHSLSHSHSLSLSLSRSLICESNLILQPFQNDLGCCFKRRHPSIQRGSVGGVGRGGDQDGVGGGVGAAVVAYGKTAAGCTFA